MAHSFTCIYDYCGFTIYTLRGVSPGMLGELCAQQASLWSTPVRGRQQHLCTADILTAATGGLLSVWQRGNIGHSFSGNDDGNKCYLNHQVVATGMRMIESIGELTNKSPPPSHSLPCTNSVSADEGLRG